MHLGWLAVAAGLHDTVLVLGVEKAHIGDPERTFSAYASGTDIETPFAVADGAGVDRTPLVDRQAVLAERLMNAYGLTIDDFAAVTARSLTNAAANPKAHRQFGGSAADVLAARVVVPPLTALMNSPVSDGGAAVVLSAARPPAAVRIRVGDGHARSPGRR